MRHGFCIVVALLLCADVGAGVTLTGEKSGDPDQSAAIFVGVKDFIVKSDDIAPVPYAVDDAVDLAFAFTLDRQPPLIEPKRVVLALSGVPIKSQSRQKLAALKAAGATVVLAERTVILQLLDRQAASVGRNGVLIVTFATHGINVGRQQYMLAAGSTQKDVRSMIAGADVEEAITRNEVPRALVLIDACREQVVRGRAGAPDPRSMARLLGVLKGIEGTVVISAASAGGYAYDDNVRRNGVFTAAVLDALQCGAAKDFHGFVTVEKLYDYVERRVSKWIKEHKGDPGARKATQFNCEGRTRKMPLAICVNHTASASASPRE